METKTREMEKEKLKLLKESTPICVFCKDNYNLIKHLILKNSYVGKELRCENCQSVYLKESEEYMPFDEKKEIEKENSEKEEKIWCDRCNDKFEKTHSCFKQNSEKEVNYPHLPKRAS